MIWCMANLTVGGQSLLAVCSGFLDPFGRLLGMDGVILTAFILGFPANEIVLPITMMAYLSTRGPFRYRQYGRTAFPAYRQRLDLAYRCQRHPLFPDALALFYLSRHGV